MTDGGTWAAGALLLFVVVGDLLLSPGYMRRVRSSIAAGDSDARLRMYRLTIVVSLAAAAAALLVMVSGGLSLAEIGLTWPDVKWLGDQAPLIFGIGVGLTAGALGAVVATRRGRKPLTVGDIDVLLPRRSEERWWFAGVALNAGVTEEVFYRALALLFLIEVVPGDATWPPVALAAVLFGVAHAYQGAAGVLTTGLMAVFFGLLFIGSGSLLPGILLHALVDLRALVLRPEPDPLHSPVSSPSV